MDQLDRHGDCRHTTHYSVRGADQVFYQMTNRTRCGSRQSGHWMQQGRVGQFCERPFSHSDRDDIETKLNAGVMEKTAALASAPDHGAAV